MTEQPNNGSARKIIIERTYLASVQEVWDLWTTIDGIESWWGPDGFSVKVQQLDLRPGGEVRYAMTATHPAQIEFMKKAGMPITTEAKFTFTQIVPGKSISYTHRIDFVPGVDPYDVGNKVEFFSHGGHVRMLLTLDPMHSDEWSQRATMGWESQLGKLDSRFAGRETK